MLKKYKCWSGRNSYYLVMYKVEQTLFMFLLLLLYFFETFEGENMEKTDVFFCVLISVLTYQLCYLTTALEYIFWV